MNDFPWVDDADGGYTVEPFDPARDQAPEGAGRDCPGGDPDAE